MCLLWVFLQVSLAELRVGHCSLVGTHLMRWPNQLNWLSQGTYYYYYFFWGGGIEPHPVSCAFHEWMRKHLQVTWLQNPTSCAVFSGQAWLLLALPSAVFSIKSVFSSTGVFMMCHFENKRDAEQSSSKTIKHFIIRDGEGTGLTYNAGICNGRTMWH